MWSSEAPFCQYSVEVLTSISRLVLGVRAGRLPELRVEEHAPHARDVGEHPVEDPAAGLVAIETLPDVIAQVAAALRDANRQHRADAAPGRVRRRRPARLVAQERHEVTRRGQAEPQHGGIARRIVEVVDRAGHGPRARRQQADRSRVDVSPLAGRHQGGRVRLVAAHGEPGGRLIEGGRLVAQAEDLHRLATRAGDQLVADRPHDGPSVRRRRRRLQGEPARRARGARVPPAPRERVALAEQQPVPHVGRGARIVAAGGRVHEVGEEQLAPAVVDLVDDLAIALRGIGGTEEIEVGLVFHEAADVAGRPVEIDDARVGRVARIDLAARHPHHALVGARRAEGCAVRERLGAIDAYHDDARLDGRGRSQRGQQHRHRRDDQSSDEDGHRHEDRVGNAARTASSRPRPARPRYGCGTRPAPPGPRP